MPNEGDIVGQARYDPVFPAWCFPPGDLKDSVAPGLRAQRRRAETTIMSSGSSPRGYTLLNTPKAAGVVLLSSSSRWLKLPCCLFLFIGIGILLGRSWTDILGARMIPGCTTKQKNGRHATYNVDDDEYPDDNIRPIRKHAVGTNVSLPIVWLMSFPASNE